MITHLTALLEQAGLTVPLGDLGVEAGAAEVLAPEAARQWTAAFNPRPVAEDEFRALYNEAILGRAVKGKR